MLIKRLFFSSIGRKYLVAISAIGLVLFLITHLAGNLLIFLGADAMNNYAAVLKSSPAFLWTARVGLLFIFTLHILLAVQLRIENRRARPQAYAYQSTVRASLASRSMAFTGMLMLSYIVYHLLHFTLGQVHAQYYDVTDKLGRHDVYTMVVMSFQEPLIVAAYVAAIFFTFLHLSHGIPSLFQSLGLYSRLTVDKIEAVGKLLAVTLFVGYTSIPIAIYVGLVK